MKLATIQWKNDKIRYGSIGRILHWLIALTIFFMLGLGWSIDFFPREWKQAAVSLHRCIGVIILVLVIGRLGWRLYDAPPALPEFMPRWQKVTSKVAHFLLYGLLFALPLTGWAMSSAFGKPVSLFGIIPLPGLVSPNRALGKDLEEIHGNLAILFAATIALHMLAALYHQLVLKDNVLARMWPALNKQRPSIDFSDDE